MACKHCDIIRKTIAWETGGDLVNGGITNEPDDKGGLTKWGMSKKAHPDLVISKLTYDDAVNVYKTEYWNQYYELLPMPMAFKLFDLGVLFGVKTAVKLFQEAVIVKGKKTIKADGQYGAITAAAVASVANDRNICDDILNNFKERMKWRINWIILKNPLQYKFKKGWIRRINYEPFVEII